MRSGATSAPTVSGTMDVRHPRRGLSAFCVSWRWWRPHAPRWRRQQRRLTRRKRCASYSRSPKRASIRSSRPTRHPTASSPTSTSRCSTTIISRARSSSFRARSKRCRRLGRRQDVHLQDPQGHLLHARSRVQGQAARADCGRPGLRLEAPARPGRQEPLGMAHRRQGRRQRRSAREGREDRQARLRRADCGARSRRSLHAADPLEAARPALPVRARGSQHDGGRARSGRGVRSRFRRAPGGNRTLHARRVQAQLEDHADRESRIIGRLPTRRRARFPPNRSRSLPRSRASGFRCPGASRST